MAKKY